MKLFSRKNKTERSKPTPASRWSSSSRHALHQQRPGLLIDDELEDLPGVRSATRDTRTGRSTVRLDEGAHVDAATLVAAVEGAGDYTARLAD
ncbi:heavy metal transporter [Streptomyces sp. NPDC059752]|uniref:heavy metal transporter n=1 Tax=unclassified Streptomyces TaxID=2593676 RepID=UPI0036686598